MQARARDVGLRVTPYPAMAKRNDGQPEGELKPGSTCRNSGDLFADRGHKSVLCSTRGYQAHQDPSKPIKMQGAMREFALSSSH